MTWYTPTDHEHRNRVTEFSESLIRAEDVLLPAVLAKRLKRGKYQVENNDLHKFCNRCSEFWPADTEFFYATKSSADGLFDWCKACYQEWRYPNGRKKDPTQPGFKYIENEVLNCSSDDDFGDQ